MGPSVFIVYLPSMGPHGLCRDIQQIVTWVLPTTMDKVCVMGSFVYMGSVSCGGLCHLSCTSHTWHECYPHLGRQISICYTVNQQDLLLLSLGSSENYLFPSL